MCMHRQTHSSEPGDAKQISALGGEKGQQASKLVGISIGPSAVQKGGYIVTTKRRN